jgi:propionaldehyde dehydrogenase
MGRVADKIIKNKLAAQKTPGTEDLHTEACSGDRGLTVVERGLTGDWRDNAHHNPSETVINNCIGMIAAGNAVVFSPHPRQWKLPARRWR